MPEMRSEALDSPTSAPQIGRATWRRPRTSYLSFVISGLLLIGLYSNLDLGLMGQTLLQADRLWLVISIGMIVPITFLRAIRFFWVAPVGALPGIGEALRLTLAASALNIFLPAKSGDLIKSYFVAKRGQASAGVAISVIVYERLCDLFGLIFWCLVGWLVGRPQSDLPPLFWPLLAAFGLVCAVLIMSERAAAIPRAILAGVLRGKLRRLRGLAEGWPDLLRSLQGRRRWIVPFSVVLWAVHLVQIWMFTVALSVQIPLTVCASLSAIALMAGQLPFTFAGLGGSDVALVVLMSRYMAPESAAAMGVLLSTRGLLPPLLGVPIMRPYLTSVIGEARRWRSETAE
jgi:uncharacterized protein (TIRG00374 family)